MIFLNGPIGVGKSSLTKQLSEDLETPAFYEKVDDMPMLKEFYAAGEDSRESLAFPLQVAFLNYRYKQLRKGLYLQEEKGIKNTVYDSSLLSDGLMAGNLMRRGEFPEVMFDLYLDLTRSMQANVSGHPFSGFPDLVVFLDISFENMLAQIQERGRDMEVIDDDKRQYYYDVWKTYQDWYNSYNQSPIVTIDMNTTDYVHNNNDRINTLEKIEKRMRELNLLNSQEYDALLLKHKHELEALSNKKFKIIEEPFGENSKIKVI